MKPSDFSIGLRQLVGILIPGSIWLAVFNLLAYNQNPFGRFPDLSVTQAVILVATMYVLGYATRSLAFRVGLTTGKLMHTVCEKIFDRLQNSKRGVTLTIFKWLRRSTDPRMLQYHENSKHLLSWAQSTVQQLSGGQIQCTNQDLLYLAKNYVLGEAELSHRLDEIEAEINLYATMVLPLLFLSGALCIFWFRQVQSLMFLTRPDHVLILVGLLFSIVSFAWRTESKRKSEVQDILSMFLVLADLKSSKHRTSLESTT